MKNVSYDPFFCLPSPSRRHLSPWRSISATTNEADIATSSSEPVPPSNPGFMSRARWALTCQGADRCRMLWGLKPPPLIAPSLPP